MHLLGATLQDHLSHGQQMEAGRAWRRVEWERGGVYGWSLQPPPG